MEAVPGMISIEGLCDCHIKATFFHYQVAPWSNNMPAKRGYILSGL